VHSQPPSGWRLLITKSGEKELAHGSDQTRHRPRERNADMDHLIFSSGWAKPRQVIERSIGVVKRFRKLCSGRFYQGQGDDLADALVIIAVTTANLIIRGEVASSEMSKYM
jgi:hypothetical protein